MYRAVKTAGELLRVLAFHACVRWEIRRAGGDQIKLFILPQHAGITEIAFANFVAPGQSVVTRRLTGKRHAFALRFDGHKSRARQPPSANHPHRPNPAAEIQRGARRGTPGRAIPRSENIVGGEAVTVAELEQTEMSADGIEGFVQFNGNTRVESGRKRSGFRPALEMRCRGRHQADSMGEVLLGGKPELAKRLAPH